MIYSEICDDILNYHNNGFIVHDIPATLDVLAGTLFNKLNSFMELKKNLLKRYSKGIYLNPEMDESKYIYLPTCILEGNIYNLVVRDKPWDIIQPSHVDISIKIMKLSLLKKMQESSDLKIKLYMPIICEEIKWSIIKNLLIENFGDMDIEIIVVYREEQKKLLEE